MEKNRFQFSVDDSLESVHNRCLNAIKLLGWKVRHDLTQEQQISCYVPIPDLLPQAPVYFASLYAEEHTTHIVLIAASDDLSQAHAVTDLPMLQAAIERDSPSVTSVQLPARIFISYRRYDSADVVGRIYDRLVVTYGVDRLFKDVNNIPIGADFRKILDESISNCGVVLAVIGRDWLTITDEQQRRRLDDPADFVRIEIETGLMSNIPVVPLLVREASMPRDTDLPDSLKALAYRHGIQIRSDPDFHRDMDRLIQALNQLLQT